MHTIVSESENLAETIFEEIMLKSFPSVTKAMLNGSLNGLSIKASTPEFRGAETGGLLECAGYSSSPVFSKGRVSWDKAK